jgi:hypothetical protein
MPIQYGEDDFPYIKEALREYIELHPNCHYHYKELFNLFKSEPCVICANVHYKEFERAKGKLICKTCWDEIHEKQ